MKSTKIREHIVWIDINCRHSQLICKINVSYILSANLLKSRNKMTKKQKGSHSECCLQIKSENCGQVVELSRAIAMEPSNHHY